MTTDGSGFFMWPWMSGSNFWLRSFLLYIEITYHRKAFFFLNS